MGAYPVVQLGQQRQYITTDDFRAYVTQANSSMKTVADIAKAHDLTEEERRAVDSEVGKVYGYTIPMAEIPKGPAPAPAAPIVEGPSTGTILAALAGGVLLGGIAGHFIL